MSQALNQSLSELMIMTSLDIGEENCIQKSVNVVHPNLLQSARDLPGFPCGSEHP